MGSCASRPVEALICSQASICSQVGVELPVSGKIYDKPARAAIDELGRTLCRVARDAFLFCEDWLFAVGVGSELVVVKLSSF